MNHFLYIQRGWLSSIGAFRINFAVGSGAGENFGIEPFDLSHAGAKDVGCFALINLFKGTGADHSTVGNDTTIADAKAALQPLHLRQQGSDIRRVILA